LSPSPERCAALRRSGFHGSAIHILARPILAKSILAKPILVPVIFVPVIFGFFRFVSGCVRGGGLFFTPDGVFVRKTRRDRGAARAHQEAGAFG